MCISTATASPTVASDEEPGGAVGQRQAQPQAAAAAWHTGWASQTEMDAAGTGMRAAMCVKQPHQPAGGSAAFSGAADSALVLEPWTNRLLHKGPLREHCPVSSQS